MTASTVIKSTFTYDIFKTKRGNREVLTETVNRLAKSIKKTNLLSANPIIVNKAMEVIDGQHRLKAAALLKLPIYYVVFDPASLNEIQLLNATVKKWGPNDFLDSYISVGRADYKILKAFIDKYHFPFHPTISLLSGRSIKEKGSIYADLFRTGEFKVLDLSEATRKADIIDKILDFSASHLQKGRGQGARFYEAILKIFEKDPTLITRLERQLIEYNLKIYRMDTTRDYYRQFEDILNKGIQGKPIRLY